jgi:predicted DCC family thiol-disulfide oxidoreductase YuxK
MDDPSTHPIVLYDGICGLCSRLNQFVLKRDRQDRFRFASLQSRFAAQVLQRHGINPDRMDTVYVVLAYQRRDESLVAKGDALVLILRHLGRMWAVLGGLLRLLPRGLRNRLYELLATNRYRLFGKYEVCWRPAVEYQNKFIEPEP